MAQRSNNKVFLALVVALAMAVLLTETVPKGIPKQFKFAATSNSDKKNTLFCSVGQCLQGQGRCRGALRLQRRLLLRLLQGRRLRTEGLLLQRRRRRDANSLKSALLNEFPSPTTGVQKKTKKK